MEKKHRLIEIEWPEFGECGPPPKASLEEFESRIEDTRAAMERHGLTHLVVYGDREHFANLAYLTGFDPRFEEAVLVVALQGDPLLIVGNECEGYLPVSPLYAAGRLRHERFQPFSLLNQPRGNSRLFREILADEGICANSAVGCVGWKYFSDSEHPDGAHAIDLPAYLVDTLRGLAGREGVTNATGILMHPNDGLRTFCSPSEIAYFEYTNILASEGMKRMLLGICEGMTDHALAKLIEYNGEPLGCHMTLATGENRDLGLSGPVGATICRGDPLSANICYWGSNSCRAGWVASSAKDLPADARDYAENFAGPYFEVMSKWYSLCQIGMPGDELARLIDEKLPFGKFGIFLNAGHLIHLDEWVSSPIYPGSDVAIHSGMAIQVDVIPSSAVYFSTRMEDGVVVADESLRSQLREQFPECFSRCQKRREFMMDVLGIDVPEEVLPLANIPAIVPPFFLEPHTVFAMR
ncbi:MAG: aminopeptidase P family N-terminal domain-containing protein [Anaerolineae bacterium]|nr:aminopeptidase P family N-terminal domain-containing protein [Anaerolineae bacterium]